MEKIIDDFCVKMFKGNKYIKGDPYLNYFKHIIFYLLMLPAIFIGTIAMVLNGVHSSIWLQNIFIWLLGTVLGSIYLVRNKEKNIGNGNLLYTIVIIALLVFPFLFNGIDNVHRWLTFGPINIYSKYCLAFINNSVMEISIKQS